ncbi:hypothetical protein EsDP_00003623 [Epichloe bromicola]|uniref:Peptidase S33 tripeptidyl aminopeptidase-like C-terminal domain-containing protein n=1 Tax=Epichloe bromicola TaxID=79588 RepID=A0ABQ0CPC5_9HYPO
MRPQHQLLVGLSASASAAASAAASANYTFPSFEWNSIRPTKGLEYHDCYTAFKCARLELPLNWKNTSDSRTVSIAMIKLPAKVSDTDPTFGGSVFTNPGGPGGSGVDLVLAAGRNLQEYIDSPGKRHYEVVSFDPRGVKNSRPVADCYPEGMLARDAVRLESRGLGSFTHDAGKLAYGLAMTDGFGKKCAVVDEQALNGGEIFAYMGTPNVARDMVEMVDKIDELRKKRGASGGDERVRVELKKRGRREDHVARLQYIGFSYGTVLGHYFSSLFPGRVGRVVLDGVCNADDYSNGGGWLTNTVDADAVVDKLFTGCFTAGPGRCALARDSDKSASDIRARFWTWLERLDESPISGLSASGNAVVLTGADIRLLLSMSAYRPVTAYGPLAQRLDSAMRGQDLQLLLSNLEASVLGGSLQDACPVANATTAPDQGSDAQTAVVCGDGDDVTSKNMTWWQSYIDKQKSASSVFASYWTSIRFPCARWRFKANWIFRGPYTTPEPTEFEREPEKDRPAAPLLFLTNRLDPVTPLSAARAMAKNHPGAGVVVQEAIGHCAFLAAYSECTKKIVAEYFHTGRVPDGEVACEAECGPWDVGCQAGVRTSEPWYVRRFPLGI